MWILFLSQNHMLRQLPQSTGVGRTFVQWLHGESGALGDGISVLIDNVHTWSLSTSSCKTMWEEGCLSVRTASEGTESASVLMLHRSTCRIVTSKCKCFVRHSVIVFC